MAKFGQTMYKNFLVKELDINFNLEYALEYLNINFANSSIELIWTLVPLL
jgi:hypothetical protein